MFHQIEKQIQVAVTRHVQQKFQTDLPVTVEQPRQSDFGEFALPIAFQLARQLKKAPKVIADELLADLGPLPAVASIEVAGNGYLNVRLDRSAYALALLAPEPETPPPAGEKIIVEHTNINPNKAAHIGHLRNAVLGDTFVRMLRAAGRHVEVQNYIDNTGVQVADVVAGFHYLEKMTTADVRNRIESGRFDYLCWDLYARMSAYYADNPDHLKWRHETLHAIEAGSGELSAMGHLVADTVVRAHLATMLRLNVEYDLLPRESEILHLNFWSTAFELLKEREAIYFEKEGKNSGCWVMPGSAFSDSTGEEDSKVIVRSNGTVTYVGKDIAYQLWKFGLLGKDFHYRRLLTYPDGHPLWMSAVEPSHESGPAFGKAERVYNVIDSRQSYLQDVVIAGLKALGFAKQAAASVHFSYEMVALTPQTCVELRIPISEEDKRKPYVEVSGRKGLGVKADDLIDTLVAKALAEVESRHPEAPDQEKRRVAWQISVSALRFFMLKFTRNSVIAFDLNEALSFEGETGPYVQYAAVRAANILKKFGETGEIMPDFASALDRDALGRQLASEDFWQLLLFASRSGTAIERAISSGEPAHVAKYAFGLAQSFNNFYHSCHVLAEQDAGRRTFLLWMTTYFRMQLERTLHVLGIEVPVYM